MSDRVFKLYIRCENEAFSVRPPGVFADAPTWEIARILRRIASDIEDGRAYDHFQTIHDLNGNDVGRFALKEE